MGRAWRSIIAGFWGGMLAGLVDGTWTLLASPVLLSTANHVHLLVIDAGMGALAGSALTLVFMGWTLAFQRSSSRTRWFSAAHAVALVLSSPILVYDAIVLFHGPKAARIPFHGLLSALAMVLGVAVVWLVVTGWKRLIDRAEPDTGQGRRRRLRVLVGITLVVLALFAGWANRSILPRLYHWFHLTLTLTELVLWTLFVRILSCPGQARPIRARTWLRVVVAGLALVLGFWVEKPLLARSQSLRFFLYEKTQLASLFARALPSPKVVATTAAPAPADNGLPPLPVGPHTPGADVVLITIDAVRADHLGCYGYGRPTSPNIDALAARGVRFEHAYTQAPHTSFSMASVMIGKYYPTLARLASSDTHDTLAKILRRYEWKTASFFPPAVFYIDAAKMKAFETNYFDFEYVKYEYLNAEKRIDQIADFLRVENPRRTFIWLHLFEPHEPYEHHPGFDFGDRDIDRYDSEIAYADAAVGKVVALLRARRPNTIVIVAADHGEEFGEHGGRYHGTSLFEEQVHVPLIVNVPGVKPHVVSGPVRLIDIPATILGLLDIPVPTRMRGTDLGPWLLDPPAPVDRLPAAFAEVEDKRMAVLGAEKLICDVGKNFCSYFDLATDAREWRDQADQRPDRVLRLRQEMDRWLSEQTRFEAKLMGAAGQTGTLARDIERGRLGDASVVSALAEALLGDDTIEARREAARLVATALPADPSGQAALRAAVAKTDDDEVRQWAAIACMRLGVKEVQKSLHSLLADKPTEATELLHVHAGLVLAEHGDAAGLSTLTDALDECGGDVPLCKRILAALGTLRNPAAVKPLIEHLAFVQTRRETVDALSALAAPASVPALIGCLEGDAYATVRAAAASALGKVGGARAIQALRAALGREHEETVLAKVRVALKGRGHAN